MLRQLRSQAGFTLIEMAVVVVIIGIAIAIAVPNFRSSMRRAEIDRIPIELESDVRLAVSAAKARGRPLQIVFSQSGYLVRDAADTTIVLTNRDWGNHTDFAATGNPLIFPWGLVQPTDVTLQNMDGSYHNLSLLPTGRLSGGVQ